MEADDIEIFKQRKLLKYLRDCRGSGTSMVSLIIPPKDQISRFRNMLTDEYGTATNIKSRVNRLSVLNAIQSALVKLKTYTKTPKNGLALYVGTILTEDNKEKRVVYGIEPIKPINTSLYRCDSKFHTEDVMALFETDQKYGFVIIDGHGTLFSTLQGSIRNILGEKKVDLPKKHGRGGQSAARFSRLRQEKRDFYIKTISELITSYFITNNASNVEGIVLAGHSEFKNVLRPYVDPRITVVTVLNINYGGKNGLNEAIELSAEALSDVKYNKEKKILKDFFYELNMDTGKYIFGYKNTIEALNDGTIETLIVHDELNKTHEEEPFVDWIAEHYKDCGVNLFFVSDKSTEGAQFVKGFGGIGGILRYSIEMPEVIEDLISLVSEDESDIF